MPYFNANNNLIQRPGNFIITDVSIIPYHQFDEDPNLYRQIITDQVLNINIFESLESPFLSGEIQLSDGVNISSLLPLTGFERIEFKLYTPGEDRGYDFSVLSGHPMMITGLRNKTALNDRVQQYTLEFCSMERVRNDQIRISKAFSGKSEDIVLSTCRDELETKKNIVLEETKTLAKYVAPRIRPLDVIKYVGKVSESQNFQNAGYLFYETGLGFHFKSYESMFCHKSGSPRSVRARYSPKIVVYRDKDGNRDVINGLQSVSSFIVKSQFNTLRHLKAGTFASRSIRHDSFNKTFTEIDFDYHTNYGQENHLEQDYNGQSKSDNGVIPFFNYSKGKTVSDFKEGTLLLESETDKTHDNFNYLGRDKVTQKRMSQKAALSSIVIEIEVPGFTGISVGEVVHFTSPSFSPVKNSSDKDNDPYLTGRYLISSIRHKVDIKGTKRHAMTVELIKDSFNKSLPEDKLDLFTGQEAEDGRIYSQYDLDDA